MDNNKIFDPITYFNLSVEPRFKAAITEKLLEYLSEYLVIRTLELLPEDQLENIQDPKELFDLALKTIPNYKEKVKLFLEDFKKEYSQKAGLY